MIKLAAAAWQIDENGEELNLCHFSGLLKLLNRELHQILWGNFEQFIKTQSPIAPQKQRRARKKRRPPKGAAHNAAA